LSGERLKMTILLCFDALLPFRVFVLAGDAAGAVVIVPDPDIAVFGGDDGRAEGALVALPVAVRDLVLAPLWGGEGGSPD
jgi:hypothetical protein